MATRRKIVGGGTTPATTTSSSSSTSRAAAAATNTQYAGGGAGGDDKKKKKTKTPAKAGPPPKKAATVRTKTTPAARKTSARGVGKAGGSASGLTYGPLGAGLPTYSSSYSLPTTDWSTSISGVQPSAVAVSRQDTLIHTNSFKPVNVHFNVADGHGMHQTSGL